MKQKVNPDIAKERNKCSFNKEELTWLFDGGKEKTAVRRKLGAHAVESLRAAVYF
jgi:hypothetical protein